jgi:peptidoglycan/LPS O-acetylase OafA/YrhL
MLISINNPILSTYIFEGILLIALLFSMRKKKDDGVFPIARSQELKGLAILLILFSHIGYFLVTDNRFLFPISAISGIGVDLFLFLSGLGLAASAFKKQLPIFGFYKKNLIKLFVPFWLALFSFLLLDFFILKIDYSSFFVSKAILGIFTTADLYKDVNSPFWYFTLILFYYLLFPVLFSKKRPWLSAIAIYAVSYLILKLNPAVISGVFFFYNLHIMSFPLGIATAWLLYEVPAQQGTIANKFYLWISNIPTWLAGLGRGKNIIPILHYALIIALISFVCYFSYFFTGNRTQTLSVIIMLAIVCLFSIKKVEFKLLYLFGIYSYEIYLLHWPILYRYDFIYKYTPAWLATVLYLIFFLGLAWGFRKTAELILKIKK